MAGEMFVVSYGYHCVEVMNKQGTILRTIGTRGTSGTGQLQFCNPTAIAIHGEMVYVTEDSNHRIQKFTTSGKYISTFGSAGSGEGQLTNPRGICIGPEGKIYVSDHSNNRISVFNANESFDRHISGELNYPWGLAFDPSGNLHVAKNGGQNVIMLTSEGNYIREYGSIQSPAGVAIDPEGYVFIGQNVNNGAMQVYNPQLQLLQSYSARGYPLGVTLDNKDGYVYVCTYLYLWHSNEILVYTKYC